VSAEVIALDALNAPCAMLNAQRRDIEHSMALSIPIEHGAWSMEH
jgi:hypothetical protein